MLPQDDDADMLDDDDIIRDVDDLDEDAEEAEGIDLFADDFENDYGARENDAYEGQGIDDEGDYEELSLAQRRELDARLNARDREARRRMPAAFLPDEDETDGLAGLMGRRRVRRNRYDEEDDMDMDVHVVPTPVSPSTLTTNSPGDEMKRHLSVLRPLCEELVENPVWASAWRASLVEQLQNNNKWFTDDGAWFDDARFSASCFQAISSASTPTSVEQLLVKG